jgi:hypothetical protein
MNDINLHIASNNVNKSPIDSEVASVKIMVEY